MTEYYAHSLDGKSEEEWQTLAVHLAEVSDLAEKFAKAVRPDDRLFAELAQLAGLMHDLGKYRSEFQEYLKKQRPGGSDTAHAVYGAGKALFDHESFASAFSIAGHHAGLYDAGDLDRLINGEKYQVKARLPEIINRTSEKIRNFGFKEIYPADNLAEKYRYEVLIRMLFSLLVDADRLNTEAWEKRQIFGAQWKRKKVPLNPSDLLQKLQKERIKKSANPKNTELRKLRNDIYEACLKKGQNLQQGFFSLTVPTGGGKTLSSMAFALAHARQHNLRRVIVVIPYLSIIEQNAKEYREIFGKENVLEHHSAIDVSRSDEDPAQAQNIEKAMETWDVPIVVTTSVQFIETLFSASPSQARKLHNVARSVVIFDEVQTLPTYLLEPLLDVLRELNNRYGSSFVFCSATQPAFKKSTNLKNGFVEDEIMEIAPNPNILYQSVQRVKYIVERFDLPWTWQEAAQKMIDHKQALCILNLRRQAYELFVAIRRNLEERLSSSDLDECVFHLSSAMCPAHRLDRIEIIKKRLKDGKPVWVISTQLIEAGVDIDFPVVFRAMGPLDSIVQSAGRCNREGLLLDENGTLRLGEVIVFNPQDGGLPQGIYSTATNISATYLNITRLATDPTIFKEYFTELYQVTPTDHQRRGDNTIQHERAEFNFRRVEAMAKVIKDDSIAVVVAYGEATDIIGRIRQGQLFDRQDIRALQRYMVNLRKGFHSDYEKLKGALTPLIPERLEIQVLNKLFYDIKTHRGVVVENLPPEELIR